MQLTFELAIIDYDMIELSWPLALGKLRSEPYQALADSLESIPGINRVEVLRYSAHLLVAPHVSSLGDLITEIQEQLAEDENLRAVLRGCGVTDYGVTVDPSVVARRQSP